MQFVAAGVVWPCQSDALTRPRQGIYFVKDKQLYRLDAHYPWETAGLSPNACRYAYARTPGATWTTTPGIEIVMIDFCKEKM